MAERLKDPVKIPVCTYAQNTFHSLLKSINKL